MRGAEQREGDRGELYQVAVQAFAQALSIAWQKSDEELKMRSLAEAANVDGLHLRPDESLEKNVLIPRAVMLSRGVGTS